MITTATTSSTLQYKIFGGSFIAGCEYSGAFPLQACCWLANNLFQQCCCSRFLHNRQSNCSGSFRHPSFRFDWIWDCAGVFFCFQRYCYTEVIANSCPHCIFVSVFKASIFDYMCLLPDIRIICYYCYHNFLRGSLGCLSLSIDFVLCYWTWFSCGRTEDCRVF